jgi:hypothetical protein
MYTDYGRIVQERKTLFHKHHIKYAHSTEDAVINILEAIENWNMKTRDNFLSKFDEIEERLQQLNEYLLTSWSPTDLRGGHINKNIIWYMFLLS